MLCFYTCLSFCPQGGSASVHVGVPPPPSRHPHPPDQAHPQQQAPSHRADTPWTRHTPQDQAPPDQALPGPGTPQSRHPRTRNPPRTRHPLDQAHPPGPSTPRTDPPEQCMLGDTSTSGRYASYWNAILSLMFLVFVPYFALCEWRVI